MSLKVPYDFALIYPFHGKYPISDDYLAHKARSPSSPAPGDDFMLPLGTTVFAARPGIVSIAKHGDAGGRYVGLSHEDDLHTLYSHLQYIFVLPGEYVDAATILGFSGSTGRSTGPHLHFSLRYRKDGPRYEYINPKPYYRDVGSLLYKRRIQNEMEMQKWLKKHTMLFPK